MHLSRLARVFQCGEAQAATEKMARPSKGSRGESPSESQIARLRNPRYAGDPERGEPADARHPHG
jgi:hypothetical protein